MNDASETTGKDHGYESTRERIISTAKSLFSKNGFAGTSIRDITEAAGVNVAAVNYHFGGKENLYLEIMGERARFWRTARKEAVDAEVLGLDDPKEVLEAWIRAIVRFHLRTLVADEEYAEDHLLFFREISSPGLGFEIIMKELVVPTRQAVFELLTKVAPDISAESSFLILSSIFGQMTHFIRSRKVVTMSLGREYDAALVEKICDHIVAFSMGGLSAYGVK